MQTRCASFAPHSLVGARQMARTDGIDRHSNDLLRAKPARTKSFERTPPTNRGFRLAGAYMGGPVFAPLRAVCGRRSIPSFPRALIRAWEQSARTDPLRAQLSGAVNIRIRA